MERFEKYSNFYSIDFFHFFAKRRKSAEKTIHRKKNRGHRTSKIIKSTHSQSDSHLPYCSPYYLARARCMTWRVNFVHSKDAQKQLARTSLTERNNSETRYFSWDLQLLCKHQLSFFMLKKPLKFHHWYYILRSESYLSEYMFWSDWNEIWSVS